METLAWKPLHKIERDPKICVVPQVIRRSIHPMTSGNCGKNSDASFAWLPSSINFWPWSISPKSLLPQNLHSLITMWKHAGRCFDKSQRVLLISAEILYLLASHELIGCRRIQAGFPETCLPAVLAATAAAHPPPAPCWEPAPGQGVGWPRAAARDSEFETRD